MLSVTIAINGTIMHESYAVRIKPKKKPKKHQICTYLTDTGALDHPYSEDMGVLSLAIRLLARQQIVQDAALMKRAIPETPGDNYIHPNIADAFMLVGRFMDNTDFFRKVMMDVKGLKHADSSVPKE